MIFSYALLLDMEYFPLLITYLKQSSLVNGNWGEWSSFRSCSVTCGGGQKERTRLCNSPAAVHGGLDCLLSGETDKRGKEEDEVATCNDVACPGKI